MSRSVSYRGVKSGTPVPRGERERAAPSPVTTYFLPPEELEQYRNQGRPAKKASRPREEVIVAAQIALTKEEYLLKRLSGMNRAQIADELGLPHQSYLYSTLQKWEIKEKAAEQAAMDELKTSAAKVETAKRVLASRSTDSVSATDSFAITLATDATSPSESTPSADVTDDGMGEGERAPVTESTRSGWGFFPTSQVDPTAAADSLSLPEALDPEKNGRPFESADYITIQLRVPLRKHVSGVYASRSEAVQVGITQLRYAAFSAYSALAELLGDDADVAAHVQAYMDRKVQEVTQTV
ncbi:hypothetical protein [Alicyclobacillus sp. ALC3]|uniref:hypothetical protein n=1 Tax=Alicyclobacillus sp. ALC3 TaxID=2796143 RepID=UPI002378402A|nr:hypothetical protein [Alicyclobacillus sp. ALC3]WDL96920.1 hypothetical protein JC200_22015 [Alicyclobacillus sp. ALC3]